MKVTKTLDFMKYFKETLFNCVLVNVVLSMFLGVNFDIIKIELAPFTY